MCSYNATFPTEERNSPFRISAQSFASPKTNSCHSLDALVQFSNSAPGSHQRWESHRDPRSKRGLIWLSDRHGARRGSCFPRLHGNAPDGGSAIQDSLCDHRQVLIYVCSGFRNGGNYRLLNEACREKGGEGNRSGTWDHPPFCM